MILLSEFVKRFPSQAAAARELNWSPQNLANKLSAKKPLWVCEGKRKLYSEMAELPGGAKLSLKEQFQRINCDQERWKFIIKHKIQCDLRGVDSDNDVFFPELNEYLSVNDLLRALGIFGEVSGDE